MSRWASAAVTRSPWWTQRVTVFLKMNAIPVPLHRKPYPMKETGREAGGTAACRASPIPPPRACPILQKPDAYCNASQRFRPLAAGRDVSHRRFRNPTALGATPLIPEVKIHQNRNRKAAPRAFRRPCPRDREAEGYVCPPLGQLHIAGPTTGLFQPALEFPVEGRQGVQDVLSNRPSTGQ